MTEAGDYRAPAPDEDLRGLISAVIVVVVFVVAPLVLSAWGAVRLFRWAGSGDHTASPVRRSGALVLAVALVVVVWGAVATGVRTVVVPELGPPGAPRGCFRGSTPVPDPDRPPVASVARPVRC